MMVARACASLAAMMDISRIRIGGVVVEAFREAFIDSLHRELEERSRLSHLKDLDVAVAQFHVLAGASALALASGVVGAATD
jgi:predicted NBD/HSP70 family sugar kinase